MIKRLLIIGVLTGTGHLLTVLALKFVTKNVSDSTLSFIAEIDSLSLLIISIVAFGLQLSATRELAIRDDWKGEYYETQSARFSLSLILTVLGFTGFVITKNFLFFLAPVFALNADYALYGRGKPIHGAVVAFFRILIPTTALIIGAVYYKEKIVIIYVSSLIFAYSAVGLAVSLVLKVNYFVKPNILSLKKYIKNINIGVASFAMFFVGLGIINVMSYYYNDGVIALVYIALKLYMIFKGIRRIMVQSFFKELTSLNVALKVDVFAIIAGIVFLNSVIFFPETIISLLFDEKYVNNKIVFTILAIAGFLSSITTSSGTRLLLQKKDKKYSSILILAALVSIISGIILWYLIGNKAYLICLCVLFGEIIISTLNSIALNEKKYWINRFQNMFPILLFSGVFALSKSLLGESIISLIGAITVFGFIMLIYINKKPITILE